MSGPSRSWGGRSGVRVVAMDKRKAQLLDWVFEQAVDDREDKTEFDVLPQLATLLRINRRSGETQQPGQLMPTDSLIDLCARAVVLCRDLTQAVTGEAISDEDLRQMVVGRIPADAGELVGEDGRADALFTRNADRLEGVLSGISIIFRRDREATAFLAAAGNPEVVEPFVETIAETLAAVAVFPPAPWES